MEDRVTKFINDITSSDNAAFQILKLFVEPYGLTGLLIVLCLLGIVIHSYTRREWDVEKKAENNIEKIPSLITAIDDLRKKVSDLDIAATTVPITQDLPPPKSPLEIEFEGIEPVRWEPEQHGTFNDEVRRKHFGISVHNRGDIDIQQVAVEIEKIEEIPNRANEIRPLPKTLGLRLKFKTNNATLQNFHADFRDRVPVISHVDSMLINEQLRVASTQRYEFPHNGRRHYIYLKVTGAKVPPVTDIFTVWVDSGGLQMQRGTV
jgi:hypothetical protein